MLNQYTLQMKTTKTISNLKRFICFLIFPLALTIGCSSNDDGDKDNVAGDCNQIITAATEFSNAATSFQQNSNETTCNNLKSAALNFISTLNNCQEYSSEYYNLEEAAEAYKNLDCTQF